MSDVTKIEDYLGFLQELTDGGCQYFLEGGQAVNFWAECVLAEMGDLVSINKYKPFTSKDCDVWISHETLVYLEGLKKYDITKGSSPAQGQVAIFDLSSHPRKRVDLMQGVYGLNQKPGEAKLYERHIEIQKVKVIDPIYLFLSKCHCLVHLDQTDRQDEKHLRMLVAIVYNYLKNLIDIASELNARQVLKEIKLTKKLLRTDIARRALKIIEFNEVGSIIPWKSLSASGNDLFEGFFQSEHDGS